MRQGVYPSISFEDEIYARTVRTIHSICVRQLSMNDLCTIYSSFRMPTVPWSPSTTLAWVELPMLDVFCMRGLSLDLVCSGWRRVPARRTPS